MTFVDLHFPPRDDPAYIEGGRRLLQPSESCVGHLQGSTPFRQGCLYTLYVAFLMSRTIMQPLEGMPRIP